MKKTYSTHEAAKRKDSPVRRDPVHNRTLWAWTDSDIVKGRKLKAAQKRGPKPKAGAK